MYGGRKRWSEVAEFLPVILGVVIGVALSALRPLRAWAFVPLAVLVAGVAASAVNGELTHELWPVFVSFDMVLAGLGVLLGWRALPLLTGRRRADENGLRRGSEET